MTSNAAVAVVQQFWHLMASNDFASVSAVLADDYVLDWPQSNERIRGAARFVQMNQEYPAHGRWLFHINRIVGGETEAVSDVSITDGVLQVRSVAFFTVVDGKITRQIEYWPDPSQAPANRAHLVEPINALLK